MPVYGIFQDGGTLFGGGVLLCIVGVVVLGILVLLATSVRVVPEPEAAQSLLICGLVLRALAAGRSGHCDRTTRRRTLRRLAWRRETPTRETRRA